VGDCPGRQGAASHDADEADYPLTRAAVVALACQLPAATGVPLSRWTGPELLAELAKAGTEDELSASPVLRILAEHPVKPWQYQPWISPRDPDFEVKATVILDLYQGYYHGTRLGPRDRILSGSGGPSAGKPTARKAQFPSGRRKAREANAGSRKAAGNRDQMLALPSAAPA
jgi:hypothetical protein